MRVAAMKYLLLIVILNIKLEINLNIENKVLGEQIAKTF